MRLFPGKLMPLYWRDSPFWNLKCLRTKSRGPDTDRSAFITDFLGGITLCIFYQLFLVYEGRFIWLFFFLSSKVKLILNIKFRFMFLKEKEKDWLE